MLTNEERNDLLAVDRLEFPEDPELGRVDTRKAAILGQAWVKLLRSGQRTENSSLGLSS